MQYTTIRVCVWAACAATLLGMASRATAAEGYTYSLFDGQSLHGWTIENDCEAEVQDGMILLKSGDGWLRSDHTYGDFKLDVEWKALQAENYDAGIYLRAGAHGKPFPRRAWQVNLLEGKEGHIGKLPGAESQGLVKPAGEWNKFEITVVGDTVSLVVNGQPAYKVGGINEPRGYIGLQVEVPKGGQFLLRNLQVTEFGNESLFNGEDFTGWEGVGGKAEDCWKVADGLLQCTGEKGSWLRSAREYDDFNLRLDYQVSPGGNSGVYVRVPADGNHHRKNEEERPAGFEVQILDDEAKKHRNLKDYQYTGSIYDIAGAEQHVGRSPGEWNTLEINCRGHHTSTIHNGVLIVDARPEDFPLLTLRKLSGYLGLQNHNTVVKFRNLRIGPPIDLETERQAEHGFVSIFNGKDLTGWEGNLDIWKVENGMMVGDSPGIRRNEFLATEKSYGDFELRLDFKLHGGVGNSGIQFHSQRVPNSSAMIGYQADIGQNYWGCLYDEHRRNKILVQAPPELDEVLKKDDWNSYVIRAAGGHIVLKINGLTTVNYIEPDENIPQSGIIAPQVHSGPPMRIDFRNIRIKELGKNRE
jgi:hypothetical protein